MDVDRGGLHFPLHNLFSHRMHNIHVRPYFEVGGNVSIPTRWFHTGNTYAVCPDSPVSSSSSSSASGSLHPRYEMPAAAAAPPDRKRPSRSLPDLMILLHACERRRHNPHTRAAWFKTSIVRPPGACRRLTKADHSFVIVTFSAYTDWAG